MSVSYARAALIQTAVLLACLAFPAYAEQQHPARKHAIKQEDPVPAPALPPPAPPPTLEQMPSQPPKVNFRNGLLTIVAQNSTLGDILRAVRKQTGTEVEIPPTANERVVVHLGPGPVREVLTALLNGSHYNYVMLESPGHPGMVDRLILTSKAGGPVDSAPVAQPPPQYNNAEVEEDNQGPPPVDISEQPVNSSDEGNEDNSQPPPGGPQQVKTPDQLLRELQQQQQLMQQQRQQQGQAPEEGSEQNHPQ